MRLGLRPLAQKIPYHWTKMAHIKRIQLKYYSMQSAKLVWPLIVFGSLGSKFLLHDVDSYCLQRVAMQSAMEWMSISKHLSTYLTFRKEGPPSLDWSMSCSFTKMISNEVSIFHHLKLWAFPIIWSYEFAVRSMWFLNITCRGARMNAFLHKDTNAC